MARARCVTFADRAAAAKAAVGRVGTRQAKAADGVGHSGGPVLDPVDVARVKAEPGCEARCVGAELILVPAVDRHGSCCTGATGARTAASPRKSAPRLERHSQHCWCAQTPNSGAQVHGDVVVHPAPQRVDLTGTAPACLLGDVAFEAIDRFAQLPIAAPLTRPQRDAAIQIWRAAHFGTREGAWSLSSTDCARRSRKLLRSRRALHLCEPQNKLNSLIPDSCPLDACTDVFGMRLPTCTCSSAGNGSDPLSCDRIASAPLQVTNHSMSLDSTPQVSW